MLWQFFIIPNTINKFVGLRTKKLVIESNFEPVQMLLGY
jgi:hypothetical protein